MVTIEVESETRDHRTSSMSSTTTDSMQDDVADMIYDEIVSDPDTGSAISDQQSFEVSSSAASPTSSAEDDEDDEGMFSGMMLYAAAGGAAALLLAFVAMAYCYCKSRGKHRGSNNLILGESDGLNNSTFVTQDNTLMSSAHSQDDVLSGVGGVGDDDVFVAERIKDEPSDSVFKL